MTASGPGTTGRRISQSSARQNLGLFRRGELAELRKVGTVRWAEAGTVVAAAGSAVTHVQVVGDGELSSWPGRTAAEPPWRSSAAAG